MHRKADEIYENGRYERGISMNETILNIGDKVKMNDKYYVNEKNRKKEFIVKTKPIVIEGKMLVWLEDYNS